MGWTVRIISILVGVAVLGFFAWWALPPFQISVVWGPDPVPRPRFIPAPPQPPKPPAPKEQARVTPSAPQPPAPPKPELVAQASLPSVPPKPETAQTAPPEPPTQSTPTPQVAPVSAPASEPPSPQAPAGLPPAKPETEAQATPPPEPSTPAAPQAMIAEVKTHLLAPERAEQERFATLEQGPAITPGLQTKRYFGVKVRDGETLEVGAPASAASTSAGDAAPAPKQRVIQLADIVVPEMGATCLDKDGLAWACGAEARGALIRLIRGRAIVCTLPPGEETGQFIARCSVGGADISLWMVGRGWGQASQGAEPALKEAMRAAKEARIGIWRVPQE